METFDSYMNMKENDRRLADFYDRCHDDFYYARKILYENRYKNINFEFTALSKLKDIIDNAINSGYGDYKVRIDVTTKNATGRKVNISCTLSNIRIFSLSELCSLFEMNLKQTSSDYMTVYTLKCIVDNYMNKGKECTAVCTKDYYNNDKSWWMFKEIQITDDGYFRILFYEILHTSYVYKTSSEMYNDLHDI